MTASNGQDKTDKEQPFVSHLLELRDRLLRMVLVVAVVFVVLFPFANQIYVVVASPLMAHLPEGTSMIATEVASPFLTPFKLSLVAAIFIAMPYILYQFWAFVAPGLYRHEQRMVLPLLASSVLLFYLGVVFAYYVVFPLIFAFFTGTAPEGVAVMTDISRYLDFVLTLFFAFGIAFEVPIATILMVWAGMTTPENLARKRPYIVVGAFLIGMLLTPPDVISQTLLAVPMWLLFEVGVFLSRLFVSKDSEEEEEPAAGAQAAAASASASSSPVFDGDAGQDIAPSRSEEDFRPMNDDEMEAELDRIEDAEEDEEEAPPDSVQDKLRRIQQYRDAGDVRNARRLLYEVLEQGDEDQVWVARNILDQLDED
jgi:sec-independent protein translocase protein TatC